jgi:hypothetical protein
MWNANCRGIAIGNCAGNEDPKNIFIDVNFDMRD